MFQSKSFDVSEVPQPIKIGYRLIRVEEIPPKDHRIGVYTGQMDIHAGAIFLYPGLDRNQAAEVIIHEILHGIWKVFGLPDNDENKDARLEPMTQERCVSSISNGLATVMTDNPRLFKWIQDALNDGSPNADSQ